MRWRTWILLSGLVVSGCAPTSQERVRDYNQDGVDLFRRGDYAHARESFQAALNLTPGDASVLYNIGQCADRMGQYSAAEQNYQQCLHASPNHLECRYAYAGLLVRENRRPEAVRMVEGWLAKQPGSAGPYVVDGWLWRQAGDLPRAQSRLQQALAIDPNNVLALTELAQVYETMNRPDRSYVLLEHALEVQPNQPQVRARLTALKNKGAGRPRPD